MSCPHPSPAFGQRCQLRLSQAQQEGQRQRRLLGCPQPRFLACLQVNFWGFRSSKTWWARQPRSERCLLLLSVALATGLLACVLVLLLQLRTSECLLALGAWGWGWSRACLEAAALQGSARGESLAAPPESGTFCHPAREVGRLTRWLLGRLPAGGVLQESVAPLRASGNSFSSAAPPPLAESLPRSGSA